MPIRHRLLSRPYRLRSPDTQRCRVCLVATATVLELAPMASLPTATSGLRAGCHPSGRSCAFRSSSRRSRRLGRRADWPRRRRAELGIASATIRCLVSSSCERRNRPHISFGDVDRFRRRRRRRLVQDRFGRERAVGPGRRCRTSCAGRPILRARGRARQDERAEPDRCWPDHHADELFVEEPQPLHRSRRRSRRDRHRAADRSRNPLGDFIARERSRTRSGIAGLWEIGRRWSVHAIVTASRAHPLLPC